MCDLRPEKLTGLIDGELSPEEAARVRAHVEECETCRALHEEMRELAGVTRGIELMEPEDQVWLRYRDEVYNRLERQVGWILSSLGAILLLGSALYFFVADFLADADVPIVVRAGLALLLAGAIVLAVSVARERMAIYRADRFREIER